jgi:hypothetical protein
LACRAGLSARFIVSHRDLRPDGHHRLARPFHLEDLNHYLASKRQLKADLPPEILAAAHRELEPDRRVLKLLGARRLVQARQPDGNREQIEEGKLRAHP